MNALSRRTMLGDILRIAVVAAAGAAAIGMTVVPKVAATMALDVAVTNRSEVDEFVRVAQVTEIRPHRHMRSRHRRWVCWRERDSRWWHWGHRACGWR